MKKRIEFYTDQELDSEANLYNYDARLYDPVIAKFLSIDPAIKDIYDPQSLNPYTYCRNNPLIYTDPSGKIWWLIIPAVLYAILHDPSEVNGPTNDMKQEDMVDSDTAVETLVKTTADVTTVIGVGGALKEGIKKGVTEITKEVVSEVTGVPTELGDVGKVVKSETTVIGRVDDLQDLQKGERSLLDRLPDQGSPKANWKQNSGVLRQEMAEGRPIRDASPGDMSGKFLNAERNLLKEHGWTFDPSTNYWMPPQ